MESRRSIASDLKPLSDDDECWSAVKMLKEMVIHKEFLQ